MNNSIGWNITKEIGDSGRWDSNPRPSRWQRDALPLSYARIYRKVHRSYEIIGKIASKIRIKNSYLFKNKNNKNKFEFFLITRFTSCLQKSL